MRTWPLAWLLLVLAPLGAHAGFPDDTIVVTRGSTVAARALPALVDVDGVPVAAGDLQLFLPHVSHQASDLLQWRAGDFAATVLDPEAAPPPMDRADYYDPQRRTTLRALAFHGGSAGLGSVQFVLSDGRRDTVANLLNATGSLVVLRLPEPSGAAGLWLGVLAVAAGRRGCAALTQRASRTRAACLS